MSNDKAENPEEFRNVFAAWKKRDSTGGSSSDIVRIGSGMSKVGSSFRSFKNASTRKLGDGAKKLTSAVDDGAKKLTDTTKKVADSTMKLTTDGAKKLTSVVTGKPTNNKKSMEESQEIVFEPTLDLDGPATRNAATSPQSASIQNNFAPISNQSQADIQAKIAARYRNPKTEEQKQIKPERKRSVVDRYMPGGDKPNNQASPAPTIAAIPPPRAITPPPTPPTPPTPPDTQEEEDAKDLEAVEASPKGEPTTPMQSSKQKQLVLSPQMTAKLQASALARNKTLVLSPVRAGANGKAILSPTLSAPRASLQDRIKQFSNANASAPSWALNVQAKRAVKKPVLQVPQTVARQQSQQEKSNWRHEMRKKRQPNKSVVPARMKNVTAAPMQLANFEPPKFPKGVLDVETIKKSIKANFLFEQLSKADLEILVQAFEKVRVHVGEEVIKQGEAGDYFYIIGKGQVSFLVNEKVVGSASAGKSFGELALLYTSPRAATVIADSNPTHLYRVDQKSFRYIMQTKAQETEGEKMKLLQKIAFLKDFAKPDLERLCNCMVLRKFKVNEVIVTKGEEGNSFYILKDGSVKITEIEAGGKKFDDVTLQHGGYFGERALITSEPRAANVIGKAEGSCFVIDRDTFEKVLGKFSKVILKSQDKVLLVRTGV